MIPRKVTSDKLDSPAAEVPFCLSPQPQDQDVLSLSIKDAEILYQPLPAEECKTLIH